MAFLWPEEVKLLQHVLKENELALAWTEEEKGHFKDDYFDPVIIPTIEHIPWADKNIPVPTAILDNVIKIFKEKIAAGVYEPLDVPYQSCWFCVAKKNGKLRLVHDLQPLNQVTIKNAAIPHSLLKALQAARACQYWTSLSALITTC